jgi:hypothetical protein
MRSRLLLIIWTCGALAALAACGETPQALGNPARQDTQAFQGPGTVFTAAGYKPGDKGTWEQQLKTRTQMGQNDYNKVP